MGIILTALSVINLIGVDMEINMDAVQAADTAAARTDVKAGTKITILDGMMGTGKSTGIIRMLNERADAGQQHEKPVILIVPYIPEQKRFKKACPGTAFEMPKDKGGGMRAGLERLLLDGKNIVTTHALLFKQWRPKTVELIRRGGYEIIEDEDTSCLKPLKITKTTIKELMDLKNIKINPDTKRIVWDHFKTDDENGDYHGAKEHKNVRNACMTGAVYMYGDWVDKSPFCVWEFPHEFFSAARKYTILTYRFESSELAAYFRTHDIDYDVVEFEKEIGLQKRRDIKSLVTVESFTGKAGDLVKGNNSMSMSWFERLNKKDAATIRNHVYNRLTGKGVAEDKVLWTC